MLETWECGTPKSRNNAFDVLAGYKSGTWKKDQQDAETRLRASRSVDKARKNGKDLSVGALRAGRNHGGAYTRA